MLNIALNNINPRRTLLTSILISFLFLLINLSIHNLRDALIAFDLSIMNTSEQIMFFLSTMFDYVSTGLPAYILIYISSILTGISIALLIEYFLIIKKIHYNKLGGHGLITLIAIIGTTCTSCGVTILYTIFAALGVQGVLNHLPYHGIEITVIATLLLLVSIYTLLKKLSNPYTC